MACRFCSFQVYHEEAIPSEFGLELPHRMARWCAYCGLPLDDADLKGMTRKPRGTPVSEIMRVGERLDVMA